MLCRRYLCPFATFACSCRSVTAAAASLANKRRTRAHLGLMTWTNGLVLIANLLVPGIRACVYNEHPSQLLIGPGAARFPLSTEATEADCALIAYAFGYDGAAFGVHHSLAYNVHAWGHIGLRACIQLLIPRPATHLTNSTAKLRFRQHFVTDFLASLPHTSQA